VEIYSSVSSVMTWPTASGSTSMLMGRGTKEGGSMMSRRARGRRTGLMAPPTKATTSTVRSRATVFITGLMGALIKETGPRI